MPSHARTHLVFSIVALAVVTIAKNSTPEQASSKQASSKQATSQLQPLSPKHAEPRLSNLKRTCIKQKCKSHCTFELCAFKKCTQGQFVLKKCIKQLRLPNKTCDGAKFEKSNKKKCDTCLFEHFETCKSEGIQLKNDINACHRVNCFKECDEEICRNKCRDGNGPAECLLECGDSKINRKMCKVCKNESGYKDRDFDDQ